MQLHTIIMAIDFNHTVNKISDLRVEKEQLNSKLLSVKQQLIDNKYQLENAINNSTEQSIYIKRIDQLKYDSIVINDQIRKVVESELYLIDNLTLSYGGFDRMVDQMDDSYPILFFPVRIETIFDEDSHQLWLRVFPDEIAIDTHEYNLVESEIQEGKMYWNQFVNATNDEEKIQAWDLLCRSFGAPRAAWIALQMEPLNIDAGDQELIFPEIESKPDSWSKQPVSYVMPDAFVIYAYGNDGSTIYHKMNSIPDELKMGIDPSLDPKEDTMSFDQQDVNGLENELVTDDKVDWMLDFEAAIAKGMGAKLDLSGSQFQEGFSKILVVGVKSTMNVDESKNRVESLFNSHHFTNGISLLKQGDNTNNTELDYSGFSSVEFGNKVTYETERLSPLFQPTPYQRDKTDGQVLCEALGIDYKILYHVFQSNGTDIKNAMTYNRLMYQSLFGYTANELLPLFGDRYVVNNELRKFFNDHIRSRGALPSIRTGNQPYGILPTSVFSRIEWTDDPNRELLLHLLRYTHSLNEQWTKVLVREQEDIDDGQKLTNIMSKHALSTEYVQRIGVGAGYVWNNIEYAALEFEGNREWANKQMGRMEALRHELHLPLDFDNKALQINYLEKQSNLEVDLCFKGANENKALPNICEAGNFLHLLANASFDEIRDENFERFGLKEDIKEYLDTSLLYRGARQSLMLEYYEAACEILEIHPNLRGESEFINIVRERPEGDIVNRNEVGPMGVLQEGESRFQIMNRLYENRGTISELLSSEEVYAFPQAINLIEAKKSLNLLAFEKVKDLSLLVNEGIDMISYRLDTWRLSLVNQRLNAIREIQEGEEGRKEGVYIGAYGWVENVKRQTNLIPTSSPTQDNQFPDRIYTDKNNKGFIHAPTLNQAVNGAVMLSAYSQRSDETNNDPLSVNLSSERIRAALDLMDGIRNGQNLGVLLGYEFERKFREIYLDPRINQFIYNLRSHYPLDNMVVDVSPDLSDLDKVVARNVVNGNKLIELLKEGKINEIIQNSGVNNAVRELLIQAVDWIWNLTDALADINATEGVFQIVQGNTTKAGAMTNSLSKGRYLHEPDVIASGKDGIKILQRFTLHLETNNPYIMYNDWSLISSADFRVKAEPYINKWLCRMLPSPNTIYCQVKEVETNIVYWVTAKEINLHPIDLMYLMQEELKDGDDQLSLVIKQFIRGKFSVNRENQLMVDYTSKPQEVDYSLNEIHSILVYAEKLLNGSRHLNTHDYLQVSEQQEVLKKYNVSDLTNRYESGINFLRSSKNRLESMISSSTINLDEIVKELYKLSFFGIEQTIFEFIGDLNVDDKAEIMRRVQFVLAILDQKIEKSTLSIPLPNINEDQTNYVEKIIDACKDLFDSNFVVLPLFEIREQEQDYLSLMINNLSTLKDDHLDNDLLTEQWLASISKIKENAKNYELVSILASNVDFMYNHDRCILPLQIPYASDGTERWLGTSVKEQSSLKEGRISFGASVPNNHNLSGDQAGIMIDEWVDVVPLKEHNTGISFHYDQPNSKAPQCLILGLTPQITGRWRWDDLIDMLNETLDLAKKRGVDYEQISSTAIGQLPGMITPFTAGGNAIGLTAKHLIKN